MHGKKNKTLTMQTEGPSTFPKHWTSKWIDQQHYDAVDLQTKSPHYWSNDVEHCIGK